MSGSLSTVHCDSVTVRPLPMVPRWCPDLMSAPGCPVVPREARCGIYRYQQQQQPIRSTITGHLNIWGEENPVQTSPQQLVVVARCQDAESGDPSA